MNGGDQAVIEGLALTIAKLNSQVTELRVENERLKQRLNETSEKDISNIVKQTVEKVQNNNIPKSYAKRFNKKRKSITLNRIMNLAAEKNLELPEIKDIIVDQEELCSKATFYRYVKLLQKKNKIDFVKINDLEVVTKI